MQGGAGVRVLVQAQETIHADVTKRNTASPALAAYPVHTAQPVTAMIATMPTNTELICRSPRLP